MYKPFAAILALLSTAFTITGCTNPYSQYYTDLTGGQNVFESPKVILPTEKPKLIYGTNREIDEKKMLEDGYLPLGFSSFNAGEINQKEALKHAKKIHASTVIVYYNYTGTVSGVMPINMPNTQTSYHSGSIYGAGGYANYSGTSTTYGTTTTYMPYNINRYDFYASFWIKATPMKLGIIWQDLSEELRQKLGSNKGVYVWIVVKDSPAFNSDILSGDVLRRVNEQEIIDSNHFQKLLDNASDPAAEFEIFRNGETIIKRVQLRN